MRLVVVPLWLKEIMHDENIAFSKAACYKTIAPHLGSKDLFLYQTQSYLMEDFFKQRYGCQFQKIMERRPQAQLIHPYKVFQDETDCTDDWDTASEIQKYLEAEPNLVNNFLTGLSSYQHVTFRVQMLEDDPYGQHQLGLFVELIPLVDDQDTGYLTARINEQSELCKTLYAHNFTLKDLTRLGLLGTLFNSNSLIV